MDSFKKYILRGDYVRSKSDGDEHIVSSLTLRRLYNLPTDECIFIPRHMDEKDRLNLRFAKEKGLIELFPLYHGNYEEVLKKKQKEFNDVIYRRNSGSSNETF